MPTRWIDWQAVEPMLSGPYRTPGGRPGTPFRVPERTAPAFGFGRIEPGPAWPDGLALSEREVALPLPAEPVDAAPSDAVLRLSDAFGGRSVLCARSDQGARWGVDPVQWIEGLLTERYVRGWRRPLPSRVPLLNYSLVPHIVKGWLEPLQSPRRDGDPKPVGFPALPLDDLVETLRRLCWKLAGGTGQPAPPWPDGCRAAVTLTHDVDTPWILDPKRGALLDEILDAECSRGFKGAWYVVASRIRLSRHADALARIAAAGHEIGSHGWNHDARLDYVGPRRQARRIERALERLGDHTVAGIRTPWNCRSPGLLRVLASRFAYDASVPSASSFYSSGSNSGCCSVFPFRHPCGLVEVPATLPPDTGLPASERIAILTEVADRVVELGGVVNLTLHPQPHQSGRPAEIAAFADLLSELSRRHGERLWRATPGEIAELYGASLSG